MATVPKTLTYEEWLRMPVTTEGREEVVDGEILTMPPNRAPHPEIVYKLTLALMKRLDDAKTRVYASVFGLMIRREPLTCRNPDLAVFVKSNMVEQDGYYCSPPELLVEVLSPTESRREQQEKLRDYETLGVPEVWLISPEAGTVEILLLKEGRLKTAQVLVEGELRPTQFPEITIPLAEIWPD